MKYDYHTIVLGAGSAGLVAAGGIAALGAKVALVESNKMGGDCLNTGCVPSKAFIKCAHLARSIQNADTFGIDAQLKEIDWKRVMNRVRSVIDSVAPHDSKERFEKMGVRVLFGVASFAGRHSIKVDDIVISAKYIVVATGSKPSVPDIPGLRSVPYYTNETIYEMAKLPRRLVVLGAGPVGLELAQGFAHLGSDVTLIDMLPHVLPHDDTEAAQVLEKVLTGEGVTLKLGAKIVEVRKEAGGIAVVVETSGIREEIAGDAVLVALGRTPATHGLNLDNADVATKPSGFIQTNSKLRTTAKNIFACGDVTGPLLFTHTAGYQAGIVLKNIMFKLGSKADYTKAPSVTYTQPEVAHTGLTEAAARSAGSFKESVIYPMSDNDRAIAENDVRGFLKVVLGKSGKLIGATIVCNHAGEMISLATLAIRKKQKLSGFLSMMFPYPTKSEAYMNAALDRTLGSIQNWQRRLLKLLF